MRRKLFAGLCLVWAVTVLSVGLPAAAGEPAWRARLAVLPDGGAAGGYQTAGGADGEFSLFLYSGSGAPVQILGRFNGMLAGVAPGPEAETVYALTADGALGVYGGESSIAALPDERWHMLDLTVFGGEILALHCDADGSLRLARPDGGQSWTADDTLIARDTDLVKAVLVSGSSLHLIWCCRSYDLSKGTLRHAVFQDGRWTEGDPIPAGHIQSFAAFLPPDESGLELALAAVTADPLDPARKEFRVYGWSGESWRPADNLPGMPETQRLYAAADFAAAAGLDGSVWLSAGRGGAVLESAGEFFPFGAAEEPAAAAAAQGLVSLTLLGMFVLLLAVYARRSRRLSRLQPGRPADLISRCAALGIDWVLVSAAMTAYHLTSGDVRVLDRLLTPESVSRLFWLTLGALALYAAVFEGLYGFTPGKFLCGMRVRSALGGPPALIQCLLRNILRAADMFPLPVGIPGLVGLVSALLNKRRQRIGDRLALTVVRRHAPVLDRKFLLASASPRRLELMQALGADVTVQPADIDEDAVQGTDPEQTARLLAEAKASAVASRLEETGPVLVAADTMVVIDGDVLGKPADAAEARQMLGRLSGRSHTVVTGVTVWDSLTGQGLSDVEITEVEFRDLSEREIDAYVASGDPMDKAGAYGIQSGTLVRQVRGSLSNVAGLPMEKLQTLLGMLDS